MVEEYEDYIIDRPEGFRLLDPDQFAKAKEYKELLYKLSKGNMTVKELHSMYKQEDGTYTKTLKTVYRHLDALEKQGLVKVAGHRKYKGARSLEKLYCRSAKLYTDSMSKSKDWVNSEDGELFLNSLTELLWRTREKMGDRDKLSALVVEFFKKQQETTVHLMEDISSNGNLADLLEELTFDHIQALLEIAPPMLTLLENPDLYERLKEA